MKTIEIVSHCWAKKLPHYASALRYQLSSLILNRPKRCKVKATICYSMDDSLTNGVLDEFESIRTFEGLDLQRLAFSPGELGRRSIGRNLAAKITDANIVWFSDVDQCFRDGILDLLATMKWPSGASMIFPGEIQIHKDHATGDVVLANAEGICDIDPTDFISKRYSRAIGGVQIVQGSFARQYGYLNHESKWQLITNGNFDRCRCDQPYRKFCGEKGKIQKVRLPGLYRLRHTESGHGRAASTGGGGFKEGV